MKFYYCPKTRAARILWLVEELALDYERVTVDVRDPVAKLNAEFLAASPMGKVPAIWDGETKMAETAAIGIYLADKYAPGVLAPRTDDPLRGRYLYWMLFTPAVIEPAMSEKFRGLDSDRFRSGWGDFELMTETLDKGVTQGPWLLGETFTAADVIVGLSAIFMKDFNILGSSPAIDAYVDRCRKRPAYQKMQAIEAAAS